eukprot:CAMPEP_0206494892 /NCGR_PEP_ID=MMETSP0324_2-20121206/48065_1 /ASSEMBLY_ACC=CAM_ASM_000836 /TAXON_ID=2866 /ORGANISM="Crypthecodinium cohnii, Strain Seligo" /LENGTH=39 /DNA_ID= /DNA_START= /DNA_END= /DNA_ORIENTATION=
MGSIVLKQSSRPPSLRHAETIGRRAFDHLWSKHPRAPQM